MRGPHLVAHAKAAAFKTTLHLTRCAGPESGPGLGPGGFHTTLDIFVRPVHWLELVEIKNEEPGAFQSGEMAARYTYEPLKDNRSCFRLLRIDSASEACLQCTLQSASVPSSESQGHYLALSYCWGHEPASREIQVNGKLFSVTNNLFFALKAILRFKADLTGAWIWTDAICINQNDATEKSLQIQHMGRIFAFAETVVVWLGENKERSESVMKVFQWLDRRKSLRDGNHHMIHNLQPVPIQLEGGQHRADNRDVEQIVAELDRNFDITEPTLMAVEECLKSLEDFPLKATSHSVLNRPSIRDAIFHQTHWWWREFLSLVNRPWFYRVWTFQEIALAANAQVICGDHLVTWNTLLSCRTRFSFLTGLYHGCIADEALGWDGTLRSIMSNSAFEIPLFDGLKTFRHSLVTFAGRDATDPKDFIYGYLGLLDNDFRSKITIDYNLPTSRVFKEATFLACQGEGGPDCWAELMRTYSCVRERIIEDLPSWCPDFSDKARSTYGSSYMPGGTIAESVQSIRARRAIVVSPDMVTMRIQGLAADTVQCSSFSAMSSPEQSHKRMTVPSQTYYAFSYAREWLGALFSMFSDKEDADLSATWIEEFFYKVYDVAPEERFTFTDLHDCCALFQSHTLETHDEACNVLKASGWELESAQRITEALYELVMANWGRFFFVTRGGKIGFAPRPTSPGQQVCYILGGQLFQVLSPDYDEHITSAHVNGLMGEELLDSLKNEENLREFILH